MAPAIGSRPVADEMEAVATEAPPALLPFLDAQVGDDDEIGEA
jgi:hypothetical protein